VVTLAGPESVAPGESATFTAFISPAGAGGGIDVAIDQAARDEGWMLSSLEGLSVAAGNLVHDGSGFWSYDLEVVAPLVESLLDLRVTMMAFDGDADNGPGDIWNNTMVLVAVPEPTRGAAQSAQLAVRFALGVIANRHRG